MKGSEAAGNSVRPREGGGCDAPALADALDEAVEGGKGSKPVGRSVGEASSSADAAGDLGGCHPARELASDGGIAERAHGLGKCPCRNGLETMVGYPLQVDFPRATWLKPPLSFRAPPLDLDKNEHASRRISTPLITMGGLSRKCSFRLDELV